MTQHRDLARGGVIPESWLDALQQFISTHAGGFALEQATATSVRVPAGTDNAQVTLGINGRWRWNTATVTAAHPGGAAGTYDAYATASDNSFSDSPNPDTDLTNYSFGLEIRAAGSVPTTALYRRVGTVEWDGAAIRSIRQLVPGAAGGGGGRAFRATLGDGAATLIDINHNLGTRAVAVTVSESASPYNVVYPDMQISSTNVVRLIFATPPAVGEFTVAVVGAPEA